MTTERSKAADTFNFKELSQDLANRYTTPVGLERKSFQVQRITLEQPVAVLAGEELSIEPVSETEAIVTIYNADIHVAVNTRMKIKMEDKV